MFVLIIASEVLGVFCFLCIEVYQLRYEANMVAH